MYLSPIFPNVFKPSLSLVRMMFTFPEPVKSKASDLVRFLRHTSVWFCFRQAIWLSVFSTSTLDCLTILSACHLSTVTFLITWLWTFELIKDYELLFGLLPGSLDDTSHSNPQSLWKIFRVYYNADKGCTGIPAHVRWASECMAPNMHKVVCFLNDAMESTILTFFK